MGVLDMFSPVAFHFVQDHGVCVCVCVYLLNSIVYYLSLLFFQVGNYTIYTNSPIAEKKTTTKTVILRKKKYNYQQFPLAS